ncbi:MAG: prolyl oligopeptidase family serine peptidase [Planctomycetota bacterium]
MFTRHQRVIRFALLPGLILCGFAVSLVQAAAPVVYPKTQKVEQIDDYHGTKVADPYRWLEDDNSAETHQWVEAQNKVTFGLLEQIPSREKIKTRLTNLWNFERFGIPSREGGRYFYSRNDGLQNQNVLYTVTKLDGEAKVLLDPNKLSADGTTSLAGTDVTESGKHLAYGLSMAGSDWNEWKVRDIESGNDLTDHIKWVKFSGASWTKDGSGFYYSRYDEPTEATKLTGANYFHKLYYHKLGTPQSEDALIYQRQDQKDWGFGGGVTDDGRYLVINVWKGTDPNNLLFYKDLQDKNGKVIELISEFESSYDFIDSDGTVFYFQTDRDAPRKRVIAIDVTKPDRANWREVIPQAADTLNSVSLVNNKLVTSYLKDAVTAVKIYDLTGKFVRDVQFPGLGSAGGFGGKKTDRETFFSFTSYTTPSTIFRYDMETGESTVFKKPNVDFKSDDYETKQVFYKSKDGTRVPMFITAKKGLALDGNNPTYLYGYGGFNIPLTPGFSVSSAVWLEMGGVLAIPNLRGGGEYGKEWHDAGRKLNKQNVFDDFIAAAEWLIANKYTSTPKLSIGGGSNGGLLVGACMTQRPDLFGAALPAVGVLDMLRFHKFTIGHAWTSDYGSPDNPEEFKVLHGYSPLHHLKPGTSYPATMITTADHDDRVVPAHSFKFAAALQESHSGPNPVLIRIETKAGHGAGKSLTKQIEERADQWAFLVQVLKMGDVAIPSIKPEPKSGKPTS